MAARTPKTGSGPARTSGFTMIELLMTIAIGSIVMALAIPSFRYVTNSNRIAAEINGLLGDLQFARSEAIKDGQSVSVCVSTNSLTCSAGDVNWHGGWIVFSDPAGTGVPGANAILRIQKPFSSSDTFTASDNALALVRFNREGFAGGIPLNALFTLHTSPSNDAWTRCLTISFVGQVTTERLGGTANGALCS